MNIVRAAIFAAGAGALAAAVPVAAEGNSSADFTGRGGTRISVGHGNPGFGQGMGHGHRRGRDDGFGGSNSRTPDPLGDRASFDTRRHRRHDDRGRGHRVREIGLLGDNWSDGWIYEQNRTAIGNGYFGQGESGDGYYEYDRGYPYDYYDEREAAEPRAYARGPQCRTQWVPDGHGDEVPVSICRG